ncbi:ferrous iron transport protein A [Candidatus Bipolaricaulota bacterium]|nr:ferrous iron transport protein A [Candidatus Bipolaricaulota bacterium]
MSFAFSVPLASLPPGGAGRLVAIHGGRGSALRLRRLGLRPGALVRMVAAGGWGGPVLLEVDGCRVALGRGLARHILVEPRGPSPRDGH